MPVGLSARLEPLLQELGPGHWLLLDPQAPAEVGPQWFDAQYWGAAAQPLLDGGRAPPRLLQTPMGAVVWRHYRRGGLVGRWLHDRYLWTGLRRSRPWREASTLLRLRAAGLAVPRLIAARLQAQGGWYQADLLTECIADSRSLAARLAAGEWPAARWADLGLAIAELHASGCEHADLNAHNILIDAAGRIWLIDFDRARWRRPGDWGQRNMQRLQRSLRKLQLMPAAADWQRLLDAYAGRVGGFHVAE